VRNEIVSFGAPDELKVDHRGVVGGGVHLTPNRCTNWSTNAVTTSSSSTVQRVRSAHRRFKGAIVPDVSTTNDFVSELATGKYDHLKDRRSSRTAPAAFAASAVVVDDESWLRRGVPD